jgi:hypothetical protein
MPFTLIDGTHELDGVADAEKIQILEFHARTYAQAFEI